MAKRTRSRSGGWRRGEFLLGVVLGLVLALWVFPMIGDYWSQPPSEAAANGSSSSTQFDFYTVLPRNEEVVEEIPAPTPTPPPTQAADAGAETVPATEDQAAGQAAAGEGATGAGSDSQPAGVQEVPPETSPAAGPSAPTAVQSPGWYVLQIGSFTRREAAESLKARLALVGMNARIHTVRINRETWYRVRIGPTDDLGQLNADRARLQEHRFGSQLVRLVE